MTLSAAGLAAAISSAQGPAQDITIQNAENTKLATAIINYFLSNAVITVPIIPVQVVPATGTGATTTTAIATLT